MIYSLRILPPKDKWNEVQDEEASHSPSSVDKKIDNDILPEVVAISERNIHGFSNVFYERYYSAREVRNLNSPSGWSPLTCNTGALIIFPISEQYNEERALEAGVV